MSADRKVVIVTGASQGIGAGIVDGYLARGYRVIATSRSIKPSDNADVIAVSGDISDPLTAKRIVDAAINNFGRLDALVNNAGIFLANAFTGYSTEEYRRASATNLDGFFFPTQEALRVMEKQGFGHIVSITTALVNQPLSKVPSTLASITKGGIQAATQSLAVEYATRGIRVNAVAPGVIHTPMHPPETHGFLAALHPVGRMGDINEVVEAVLFLEAANFVTGQILHVDGGQTAGV